MSGGLTMENATLAEFGELSPWSTLATRLVPDDLWETIQPLLPTMRARPQGGGAPRLDDRPILVAVVYHVMTGTAWRKVPPWCWGITPATVYRRFTEWTAARVWERLLASVPPEHGPDCWWRAVAVTALQHAAEQPARQVHRRPDRADKHSERDQSTQPTRACASAARGSGDDVSSRDRDVTGLRKPGATRPTTVGTTGRP